jgi:ankyrin repeat protein
MYAAGNNHSSEVITALLRAGAKIDDRSIDGRGRTPLMAAAEKNPNPYIITTLIEAGAKVDNRDMLGRPPLMLAAQSNSNPEVIITLLGAGANPRLKSIEGKTAFDYAEKNEKVKGTEAYLELKKGTF